MDPDSSRRPWILVASLIGGGILAVILITIMLVWGLTFWRSKPEQVLAIRIPPAAISNRTATAIKTPTQPTPTQPAQSPASNIVTSTPTPATPAPMKPAVTGAPPATAAQAASNNTPTPPLAPAPTTAVIKITMPVVWPRLTVTGIIGSSKTGHGATIINGQMLGPGDSIEGVKIGSIEKQKVKLVFTGEVRFLGVGGSTE